MIAGFIIYDCLLITERLCRLCVCVQCGGKLSRHLEGPAYDVFARTLRGLANSKITKPGQFRTEDGSGSAVRCSLKVEDAVLPVVTLYYRERLQVRGGRQSSWSLTRAQQHPPEMHAQEGKVGCPLQGCHTCSGATCCAQAALGQTTPKISCGCRQMTATCILWRRASSMCTSRPHCLCMTK